MLFSTYGQNVLVLHERKSRFTTLVKTPDRKAEPTAAILAELLAPLPKRLRRTLTFDNGTEFAEHHRLNTKPGVRTFFCDPHAPWQKGGVENAIGRIRRYLPKNTNLDRIQPEQIAACINAYNHTPRKCLTSRPPPRSSQKRCTSNETPHPGIRRDERGLEDRNSQKFFASQGDCGPRAD